jgi:hypothetical protein
VRLGEIAWQEQSLRLMNEFFLSFPRVQPIKNDLGGKQGNAEYGEYEGKVVHAIARSARIVRKPIARKLLT